MWAGHGPIDLRRALAVSCNPYFEWVGEQLGYEKIQRYAHLLGLGEPSGINLTGETAGGVPAFVRPEAVGHLSSHAAGIATSAVQLAVLALGDGQRRRRAAAAAVRRRRTSCRASAGGCRTAPGFDGLAAGLPRRGQRGQREPRRSTPTSRSPARPGTCSALGWFASYAPADHPELVVVVFLQARQRPRRLRRRRAASSASCSRRRGPDGAGAAATGAP